MFSKSTYNSQNKCSQKYLHTHIHTTPPKACAIYNHEVHTDTHTHTHRHMTKIPPKAGTRRSNEVYTFETHTMRHIYDHIHIIHLLYQQMCNYMLTDYYYIPFRLLYMPPQLIIIYSLYHNQYYY